LFYTQTDWEGEDRLKYQLIIAQGNAFDNFIKEVEALQEQIGQGKTKRP
jgi:hypothetical protein